MFEGFDLDVFHWLQEIEEDSSAIIISECEIVGYYSDTAFEIGGDGEWDIYDVQVRIPGKYYKEIQNRYIREKEIIENVISEVAAQDRIHVRGITWSIKLGSRIKSSSTLQLEQQITNDLLLAATSKGGVIEREVKIGLNEYSNGNYTASLKVFYPVIEQMMNEILNVKGENINNFKGIFDKKKRLVELECINSELGESFELNKPRNGVLHGSFSPTNDTYSYPINLSAMIFLIELMKLT